MDRWCFISVGAPESALISATTENSHKLRCQAIVLAFLLLISLSGCKNTPREERGRSQVLERLSEQARNAVAHYASVDLSSVGWELANEYRLARLMYSDSYAYYRVALNNRALARQFARADAESSASTVIGIYKYKLHKVFINIDAVSFKDIQSAVRRYARKNCLNAVSGCETLKTGALASLEDQQEFRQSVILAVFVHEYAHAAHHARLPEMRIGGYRPGFTDLMKVLKEGYAEHLTEQVCKKLGCESGFSYLADYDSAVRGIKNAEKRRYRKLEVEMRKFTYNQGQLFVENFLKQGGLIESMRTYIHHQPSSVMAVVDPQKPEVRYYPQSNTDRLLNVKPIVEAFYPEGKWTVLVDVPDPPRAVFILSEIMRVKQAADLKNLGYQQIVLFSIAPLKLFERYLGKYDDGSQMVILRDFGGEQQSQLSFDKEYQRLNRLYKRVGLQYRKNGFRAASFQAGNEAIILGRNGRFTLLAVTEKEKYSLPTRANQMVEKMAMLLGK